LSRSLERQDWERVGSELLLTLLLEAGLGSTPEMLAWMMVATLGKLGATKSRCGQR
jgi:hypothetical protein